MVRSGLMKNLSSVRSTRVFELDYYSNGMVGVGVGQSAEDTLPRIERFKKIRFLIRGVTPPPQFSYFNSNQDEIYAFGIVLEGST